MPFAEKYIAGQRILLCGPQFADPCVTNKLKSFNKF